MDDLKAGRETKIHEALASYYETMSDSAPVETYHERHGTESALILTVFDDVTASMVADVLRTHVAGKVVVEIGAGIGLLACHVATMARKVYAIDVDPAWTSSFLACLWDKKPRNLTFIFGDAEQAPPFSADVAYFCTHSGHDSLRRAGQRFAPVVIDVYRDLLGVGLAATRAEGE
jgi:hypothetical protein